MKTSNKILLGILMVCFGFFISSHLILHGKYVRKEFVLPAKADAFFFHEHTLPIIHYVQLNRLDGCELISSDTAKLLIEKSPFNTIDYRVSGDTLFVNGSDKWARWATPRVKLYIPQVKSFIVTDCNVNIKGNRDSTDRRNYHFELNNGHLFTRYYFTDSAFNKYFDTLSINARNSSEVVLNKRDYYKLIDVNLDNSAFLEKNAKREKINITADSTSIVVTGGKDYNRYLY